MKSQFWLMAVIVIVSNGDAVTAQSRFPAPESAAALKRLRGDDPTLPAWALAMAEALPRTTGAMLHLDAVHRTQNPLGATLTGKLRWVAADAVGCEYAKKYAEADLPMPKVNVATDIWDRTDGLSLAGFNQQPVAVALFTRITTELEGSLTDSNFPPLARY